MRLLLVILIPYALSYGHPTQNGNTNVDSIERCSKSQINGNVSEHNRVVFGESSEETVYSSACKIAVSAEIEIARCQQQRLHSLTQNRKYYELTDAKKTKSIEFPWGDKIPFLNQKIDAVRNYTAFDEIDSKWIRVAAPMRQTLEGIAGKYFKKKVMFESLHDYKELYRSHVNDVKEMEELKYISNPAVEDTFTQIVENDEWMSDDIFVQQRLAGPCPFLIKLVTVSGSAGMKWEALKPMLNQAYDFNAAVNRALQTVNFTLELAVTEAMVYVLYNEENSIIKARSNDFFSNRTQLQKLTSPIALFVRTLDGTLKVVAIQMDYSNESDVFSPASDNTSWLLAKSMVNLADSNYCQGLWHLSHVHLSSSVYCNIFRAHFSDLHPIYHIMRHHCEGTVPHMAVSWVTLVAEGSSGDKFWTMGSKGFATLALIGRSTHRYGLLAYDELLKARGLDSKRINYHPFRDDGELLWTEFQSFAGAFVDMFYKDDSDIETDEELQSFANEVSADGRKAPNGGRGKVVNFPSSFSTKKELSLFITRFIWLVAMHSAVNYPIEPWLTFAPISPAKLYVNNQTHENNNIAPALPDIPTTVGGLAYATLLGNFRVNRIMDHYDKIRDEKLSNLVKYHHNHLHSTIQRTLEARNADRKANKLMGFQYFEPKWLTNSIHV